MYEGAARAHAFPNQVRQHGLRQVWAPFRKRAGVASQRRVRGVPALAPAEATPEPAAPFQLLFVSPQAPGTRLRSVTASSSPLSHGMGEGSGVRVNRPADNHRDCQMASAETASPSTTSLRSAGRFTRLANPIPEITSAEPARIRQSSRSCKNIAPSVSPTTGSM